MPEERIELTLKTCGFGSKIFLLRVSNQLTLSQLKQEIYPKEFTYHYDQQGLLNWLANRHIKIKHNDRVLGESDNRKLLFICGASAHTLSYVVSEPRPWDEIREAECLIQRDRCKQNLFMFNQLRKKRVDERKNHLFLPEELCRLIINFSGRRSI